MVSAGLNDLLALFEPGESCVMESLFINGYSAYCGELTELQVDGSAGGERLLSRIGNCLLPADRGAPWWIRGAIGSREVRRDDDRRWLPD